MKGGGNLIIGAAFYIDGGAAVPPPNAMVDPPLDVAGTTGESSPLRLAMRLPMTSSKFCFLLQLIIAQYSTTCVNERALVTSPLK